MVSITARALGMAFHGRQLFSGAELSFTEGDCIYLSGDNGSGKSTLMRILAGLERPSHGHVTAEGFPATGLWRSNKLLGRALYLHQHPYLYEGTVTDNLLQVVKFARGDATRLRPALALAQLASLQDTQASHLSGGERQRLALARAWLLRPRLLMLDEPVSNMDQDSRELVLAMTCQLKTDGAGLLIASHQQGCLTELCRQRWHIGDGRVTTGHPLINNIHAKENHYAIAH